MNRFLAYSAFAVMSVLFVGCSTPQQSGPHADANQDALTVQRLARLHACDPVRDAMPMSTPGDAMQRFEVHCSNGQTLAFGCHDGECAESPVSATVAGAPAAPAVAATYAPATSAQPRYQDPAPAGGAFAARYSNPLRFAASLGGAFGGDSLATVTYSNNSSVNLDAGRGAQFSFGVDYRIDPQFAVLANAGYQVVVAAASNGNLRFQRYPLEGIGYYYLNNQWRVGPDARAVAAADQVRLH